MFDQSYFIGKKDNEKLVCPLSEATLLSEVKVLEKNLQGFLFPKVKLFLRECFCRHKFSSSVGLKWASNPHFFSPPHGSKSVAVFSRSRKRFFSFNFFSIWSDERVAVSHRPARDDWGWALGVGGEDKLTHAQSPPHYSKTTSLSPPVALFPFQTHSSTHFFFAFFCSCSSNLQYLKTGKIFL